MALILVTNTGIFSSKSVNELSGVKKSFFKTQTPDDNPCHLDFLDKEVRLDRNRLAYKNIAWSGDKALYDDVMLHMYQHKGALRDDDVFSIVFGICAGKRTSLTLAFAHASDKGVGVRVFHAGPEGISVTDKEGGLILVDNGQPIVIAGKTWSHVIREYWELNALPAPMAWQCNLTTDVGLVSPPSLTNVTKSRMRSMLAHKFRVQN